MKSPKLKTTKSNTKIAVPHPPMGTVLAFALNETYIPEGWLKCDGEKVSSQYPELKKVMEYTPNLNGRTIIGLGKAGNAKQNDGREPNFPSDWDGKLKDIGGEFAHKLTVSELPAHSHSINNGNFGMHHRSFEGNNDSDRPFKTDPQNRIGTDKTGEDQLHNNMSPYMCLYYIIKAF